MGAGKWGLNGVGEGQMGVGSGVLMGQGADGGREPDGVGQMGVISKHPLGTAWHETTLMSHRSGILHSLSFIHTNFTLDS